MRRLEAALPSGRALIAIDVALAIWAIVWIVLAILVGRELPGLGELSDTVVSVGRAAESSGAALGLLAGNLPVIGGAIDVPADQIREAGRSAQVTGESSRENIDALTALLAPAVGLMPSLPLLALYLPARVGRVREARAVEAARDSAAGDPAFEELLARRAAVTLSYRQLAEVTPEPWRDLAAGRFERLARAELERLGLNPP
jgi:hypothetical protein